MKKLTAIAVAATLALATPVFAQQSTGEAVDPSLPTESTSDFGVFLNGFGSSDFTSAYDVLDSATSFNVFKLSGMANASAQGLEEALSARENDMGTLRDRITGNPQAVAAIEAQGYSVDDIVAIQAQGEASIIFYVNDL